MSFLNITPKTEEITNIEVEWQGEKFNAEVRLNSITKRFLKSLANDADANEKLISKVYKSADLSLDGENKIEITSDILQDLPVSLVAALSEAAMQARENKKKPE